MNGESTRHCWFSFYAQDFYCGTLTMSSEAVGGYIRLLCVEWAQGPLPSDDASLLRLSGVSSEALAEIKSKFRICERISGGTAMVNDRLEREREIANEKSIKGSKIARIRWEREHQKPQDAPKDANAMRTHLPSDMPSQCSSQSHKDNTASLQFDIRPERNGATTWKPSEKQIARLRETFPAVDVLAECRKASLWCENHPDKRKTAKGMPKFLASWMENVKPKTTTATIEAQATAKPISAKLDTSEIPEFWANHLSRGAK